MVDYVQVSRRSILFRPCCLIKEVKSRATQTNETSILAEELFIRNIKGWVRPGTPMRRTSAMNPPSLLPQFLDWGLFGYGLGGIQDLGLVAWRALQIPIWCFQIRSAFLLHIGKVLARFPLVVLIRHMGS